MTDRKDKVLVIVTETVQHVYLMDPEAAASAEAYQALPRLLHGSILESLPIFDKPPAVLGKRAVKGVPMPGLLQKHTETARYSRFTGVTFVLPDEHGDPSLEVKATLTTISQKPVKA